MRHLAFKNLRIPRRDVCDTLLTPCIHFKWEKIKDELVSKYKFSFLTKSRSLWTDQLTNSKRNAAGSRHLEVAAIFCLKCLTSQKTLSFVQTISPFMDSYAHSNYSKSRCSLNTSVASQMWCGCDSSTTGEVVET